MFNDELSGNDLELVWELREGSPANWLRDRGSSALKIAPGQSVSSPITFKTPKFNTFLFLVLKVRKGGTVQFEDTNTCFEITGGEDFRSEFNGEERQFK